MELSRHAEYMVDMEEKKVSRFLRGLRPNIQSQLIMLMLTEYSDAVNRALLVERSLDERQKIFERSKGRRSGEEPPRGDETLKKHKIYQIAPQQTQEKAQDFRQGKVVVCHKCGKVGHSGNECRSCYLCGKPGHIRAKCPQLGQQSGTQQVQVAHPPPMITQSAQRPQGVQQQQQIRGRAYALVQPDRGASSAGVDFGLGMEERDGTTRNE